MKKGSLIALRESPAVAAYVLRAMMEGKEMPKFGRIYTLAEDITKGICSDCGGVHELATLEEMPELEFNAGLFEEIQPAEEVNVSFLLEKSEAPVYEAS